MMRLVVAIAILLVAGLEPYAMSQDTRQLLNDKSPCEHPVQRKAWNTLSSEEKNDYIRAELCLMEVPASENEELPNARTIFQALQEQHQKQFEHVHEVGGFLPFHRYMTWAHEHLLRTKCNYKGAQPWWDEERDSGKFTNSSIFDPNEGFGGRSPGCVKDGPFANYTLIIGPGKENKEHCLSREINEEASTAASTFYIQYCKEASTFVDMWDRIEFYPHSAGHTGVGGEMMNPVSSPGDPLFYLHHAFIDKLWWDWQTVNPGARLYAIGGPNVRDPNRPAPIPDEKPSERRPRHSSSMGGEERVGRAGDDSGNTTTLAHTLSLLGILPDVTSDQVMDIRGELLCYDYI